MGWIYTVLHPKWMTNKDLVYIIGNSAQCHRAAWMGGEFVGEWIHVLCLAETITTLVISYTLI